MGVGSGGTNCEFVLLGRPSLIVLCFAAKNLLPPFPLLYFPSHYFSLLPPLLSSPFIPLHYSLLHSCLIFSPHSPFFPPFFSFSSPSFSPSSPPSLLLFHPPLLSPFLSSPGLPPQSLSSDYPSDEESCSESGSSDNDSEDEERPRRRQSRKRQQDDKLLDDFFEAEFRKRRRVSCVWPIVGPHCLCVCIRADRSSLRVDSLD